MAGEATICRDLVVPLDVPAPQVLLTRLGVDPAFIALEDVGTATVEQAASTGAFLAAARTLVDLRSMARQRLATVRAEPVTSAQAVEDTGRPRRAPAGMRTGSPTAGHPRLLAMTR